MTIGYPLVLGARTDAGTSGMPVYSYTVVSGPQEEEEGDFELRFTRTGTTAIEPGKLPPANEGQISPRFTLYYQYRDWRDWAEHRAVTNLNAFLDVGESVTRTVHTGPGWKYFDPGSAGGFYGIQYDPRPYASTLSPGVVRLFTGQTLTITATGPVLQPPAGQHHLGGVEGVNARVDLAPGEQDWTISLTCYDGEGTVLGYATLRSTITERTFTAPPGSRIASVDWLAAYAPRSSEPSGFVVYYARPSTDPLPVPGTVANPGGVAIAGTITPGALRSTQSTQRQLIVRTGGLTTLNPGTVTIGTTTGGTR